ncbi:uncharacterized protein [Amphiura filiformis]|uniref:uncharacterized protein n=1 Tax=Amphiura filiformis TaxID=82378 RepID=UPI003B21D0BB
MYSNMDPGRALSGSLTESVESTSEKLPLIQKDRDLIKHHSKVWMTICILFQITCTILIVLYCYAIGSFLPTFDKVDKLLHFFANISLLIQLAIIVVISWYCNFAMCKTYVKKCFVTWLFDKVDSEPDQGSQHLFSLHGLYRRLKYYKTELSSFNIITGALKFYLWPLFNVGVVCYVYYNVDKPMNDFYDCPTGLAKSILYRTIEIIVFIYYGFFTAVIYLVRKTFAYQMKNIVRLSPVKTVEDTQSSITQIWLQLQDYRTVVGWWLCFASSIGILQLAVQWNWAFDDQIGEITAELEMRAAEIYRFWMWSNTLMLFSQPLVAAGGHDVDYLWGDFKNGFMKYLQAPQHQEKLTAIFRHTKHVYSEGEWMKPTMALTFLTLFLSFNIPQQFVWFWVRPGCVHETFTTFTAET